MVRFTTLGALFCFALLTGVVTASPPQPPPPLAWVVPGDRTVFPTIELDEPFGYVTNPTWMLSGTQKCPWDIDDSISRWTNNGQLAAGATVTTSECLFSDAHHVIALWMASPSPNLELSLALSSLAPTQTFTVLRDDSVAQPESGLPYGWRGCVDIAILNSGPYNQPVEGSGGGYANPTTITVTLHNSGAVVTPDRRHAAVTAVYDLTYFYNQALVNARCPSGYQLDVTGTPLGSDPVYHYSGVTP